MHLDNVVLLAANTSRSKAYAQVLKQNDITLRAAVFFERTAGAKPGQSNKVPERNWPDCPVFLPDLSLSVLSCLEDVCGHVVRVDSDTVNDVDVVKALKELAPEIVIYSGYGSQIVGAEILASCPCFLHLHAGWLPDFRGSTTTYYHLLEDAKCAVSALLLDKAIDCGPILARMYYPKPPAGVDIDHLYDGAIRADLLLKVLQHYEQHAELPRLKEQSPGEGNTYYIIHPVLKHIAILSLQETGSANL